MVKWLKRLISRLRVFERLRQIEVMIQHHQHLFSTLNPCRMCGSVTEVSKIVVMYDGVETVPVCGNCVGVAKKRYGLKTGGQIKQELLRQERKRARQAERTDKRGGVDEAGTGTEQGANGATEADGL